MGQKALRRIVGSRTIAFKACYAKLTGSIASGVFLSQALYWQEKMGWGRSWYKTQEDWEAETTLSRFQQEKARKVLCKLGILEEARRGLPAKLYYKVSLEKLVEGLEKLSPSMRETSTLECEELPGRTAGNSQPVQESTQEKKAEEPPSVEAAPPSPLVQPDCSEDGQEEDEDEDGVFLALDEDDLEPEPPPPKTKSRGKPRREPSPGSHGGAGGVYMVWSEFWDLLEACSDSRRPNRIDGKTAGRLKRDLIGDYTQQKAVMIARLAVLDWEAIQGELWKATKRGKVPSMEDVIDLRHDLAPYLETGVTSNQHRVSQFKRRFGKGAVLIKPAEIPGEEAPPEENPLKAALRKKRGGR